MRIILAAVAAIELTTGVILGLTGHRYAGGAFDLAAASSAGWALAEHSARSWKESAAHWRGVARSCRPEDRP